MADELHNSRIPSNLRWGHQRKLRSMKVPRDDIPPPPRHFPTGPVVNCTGATPANHHHHHQLEEQQPISRVPFFPKSFAANRCQNYNATVRSPAGVRRIPCSTTTGATAVSVGETSTRVRLKITDHRSNNDNNNKSWEDQSKVQIPQDKEENKEPPRLVSRPRRACATALYKGGTLCVSHLLCGKGISRGASETTSNVGGGGGSSSSSHQPIRFKISLSKDEIANDFLLTTGEKSPRKPTRRPRRVQQHLKALYPASKRTWSWKN